MEQELRTHLRTCAEAYSAHTGDTITTISTRAVGDWRFLNRILEEDASFTVRLYDRAMGWFVKAWPRTLPWPAEVPWPRDINAARTAPRRKRPSVAHKQSEAVQ